MGWSGRNIDYLRDLTVHLHDAGEPDTAMETLLGQVEALEGRVGPG